MDNVRQTQDKKVSKLKLHHEIVSGALVQCDGSKYGQRINNYLHKKAKKPTVCGDCGFFKAGGCRLGYATEKDWPACSQAIEKTAPRSY